MSILRAFVFGAVGALVALLLLFAIAGDEQTTSPTTTTETTWPTSTTTTTSPSTSPSTSTVDSTSAPTTTAPPTTVTSVPSPTFPTRESVGVPDGVELTLSIGNRLIVYDGAILDGLEIRGNVIVRADDVTIRNTRIEGPGGRHVVQCDGCRRLVVEDSTIIGTSSAAQSCIAFTNYTLRRSELAGCIDGAKANGDNLIVGNWIGGLRRDVIDGVVTHNDGIQSTGGVRIVIVGNTVVHDTNGQTSAIKATAESRPLTGIVVEGNRLISSTCYVMYFTQKPPYSPPTGRIVDNVVSGNTCANWLSLDVGPDQVIERNGPPAGVSGASFPSVPVDELTVLDE